MDKQNYVPNDVFKFDVMLDWDFFNERIVVYTKPFQDTKLDGFEQEYLVKKKYFTQEKIDELKQTFIQRIQECKNPFIITCADRDGDYNVTEDMLFNLDKEEKE